MDEEGEEEGVMDIGVAASEAEMITWIPGTCRDDLGSRIDTAFSLQRHKVSIVVA